MMLRSMIEILGYGIEAQDGILGSVVDFYVDELDWTIRYLVADTGNIIPGRKVLISTAGFYDKPDWTKRLFRVILTKDMIMEAMPAEKVKPVSRRKKVKTTRTLQWPVYWNPVTAGPPTIMLPPSIDYEEQECEGLECRLRSIKELTGYHLLAVDGMIGHTEDFIIEDDHYSIRYLVANTNQWIGSRKVLIAKDWINHANWLMKSMSVVLTKHQIKKSPVFDPDAPVNRDYEGRLYDYYGRPCYWQQDEP